MEQKGPLRSQPAPALGTSGSYSCITPGLTTSIGQPRGSRLRTLSDSRNRNMDWSECCQQLMSNLTFTCLLQAAARSASSMTGQNLEGSPRRPGQGTGHLTSNSPPPIAPQMPRPWVTASQLLSPQAPVLRPWSPNCPPSGSEPLNCSPLFPTSPVPRS